MTPFTVRTDPRVRAYSVNVVNAFNEFDIKRE